MMNMKAELLSSLKTEIAGIFQKELDNALAGEFGVIKSELQAIKMETASNATILRSDMETIKTTVSDIEHGLSACSDDIACLQNTAQRTQTQEEWGEPRGKKSVWTWKRE